MTIDATSHQKKIQFSINSIEKSIKMENKQKQVKIKYKNVFLISCNSIFSLYTCKYVLVAP